MLNSGWLNLQILFLDAKVHVGEAGLQIHLGSDFLPRAQEERMGAFICSLCGSALLSSTGGML